jgi:hypothetical protein
MSVRAVKFTRWAMPSLADPIGHVQDDGAVVLDESWRLFFEAISIMQGGPGSDAVYEVEEQAVTKDKIGDGTGIIVRSGESDFDLAEINESTGVTVSKDGVNYQIAIGQDVSPSADVSFGDVAVGGAISGVDADQITEGTTNKFTTSAEKTKLSGIESGAQVNTVTSVNSLTGAVSLNADDIPDGTSRVLVTPAQKSKIDGVEAGAQVNVVQSVNGETGAVLVTADDVPEGSGSLYYTDARADARIAVASVTDLTDVTSAGSGAIITTAERSKLAGIAAGADVSPVSSVNGATGVIVLDADDITDGTTNKAFTAAEQTKLAGIAAGAEVNVVDSVAGKTGAVTLAKGDVSGLGDADNVTFADVTLDSLLITTAGTAATAPGDFTADEYLAITVDGATRYIPLRASTW